MDENPQEYIDKWKHCQDNKSHFLRQQIFKGEARKIFVESATGYCKHCRCLFFQHQQDDNHYTIWINPINMRVISVVTRKVEDNI